MSALEVVKNSGFAGKSSWKVGYQSGPNAVYSATCGTTTITSFLACGITASRTWHRYVANLVRLPQNMRYLNAKSVTCTTCGTVEVQCRLYKGESAPPTNVGFTATRTW